MGKPLFRAIGTFILASFIVLISVTYLFGSKYVLATDTTTTDTTASKTSNCEEQQIDIDKYGGATFTNPKVLQLQTTSGGLPKLEVKYLDARIAGCNVHLRTYNGQLVGPTIRAKKGDTITLQLVNSLPANSSSEPSDINIPHHFNSTNLHTHGLHVSPKGDKTLSSDNVLLKIEPGETVKYSFSIPKDHPGGTYWYHAHLHGSTALQVSSSMAGALVIEGGLDEIDEVKAAQENIFVFQQIGYDTKGEIENYDKFGINLQTGNSKWTESRRQTTINGQIYPVIEMRPGEVQHWRFIHAGVRDTLELSLRSDNNQVIPLREIAVDGIALGKIDSWKTLTLEPGYRSDILVKADLLDSGESSREYFLSDKPSTSEKSLLGAGEAGQVLAKIVVKGDAVSMSLPTDAQVQSVKKEEAPPDITDAEIANSSPQEVVFNISAIDLAAEKFSFMVNGQPYDPSYVRTLKLNTAEKWNVSTDTASLGPSHPFHIHVNPFQHTRLDPNNYSETVWRDTLVVKAGDPQQVLTRYTEFTGQFVLHCHILDHEDQGMMEKVEIVN